MVLFLGKENLPRGNIGLLQTTFAVEFEVLNHAGMKEKGQHPAAGIFHRHGWNKRIFAERELFIELDLMVIGATEECQVQE